MIVNKIRKRNDQIPQVYPADRSAYRYTQNAPPLSLGDHFGSEKPKLPQGKPAGFFVPYDLSAGDQRGVSQRSRETLNCI